MKIRYGKVWIRGKEYQGRDIEITLNESCAVAFFCPDGSRLVYIVNPSEVAITQTVEQISLSQFEEAMEYYVKKTIGSRPEFEDCRGDRDKLNRYYPKLMKEYTNQNSIQRMWPKFPDG